MTRTNPETRIQRAIIDYLKLTGLGLVKRVNTGQVWVGGSNHPWGSKGRPIRFGEVGHSDLVLELIGDTRNVFIEVKCPGNRPTPAQVAFLDRQRARGHFALWTTGIRDLYDQLHALGFKGLPVPQDAPRSRRKTHPEPSTTGTPPKIDPGGKK